MSANAETENPLVLTERFAIYAGRYAVEAVYGPEHPLALRFHQTMDGIDWNDTPPLVLDGKERALTLNALFVQAVLIDTTDDPKEQHESAAAAHILGRYFALTIGSPDFTAATITAGLIRHDPAVEEPVSASIPVFAIAA